MPGGTKNVCPALSVTAGLPVLFEDERALEDVADFLAGVRVRADGGAGLKFRDGGHRFAARHRQLRLLDHGALEPGLLSAEAGDERDRCPVPATNR